jgi:electron transfer flavoprotein beta subunit
VWEYVLSGEAALTTLLLTEEPLVLVGHSHVALQIRLEKDRLEAEVTALTMGRAFAANLLPAAASLGADKLYCVSDPVFAGSDTYATASILSQAIRHVGGADLALCGRRARKLV